AKDFFRRLEDASAEIPLPVWTGELYLEKHQGTYTSQAANKAYNRICERELHRLEFLGAAASCLCPDYRWNADRVRRIWETVLLYQFHDILPGSSIDRVYRETGPSYEEVLKEIRALSAEALDSLRSHPDARPAASLLNLSPFDNPEPSPETGICPETPARAYCFTEYTPLSGGKGSRSEKSGEDYLLDNGRLTVRFSAGGTVLSVRDGSSGREFLSGESNRLFVYRDPCDGWEVPDRAENPPEEELRAISSSCGRKGETAFLSFLYRFRGSEIRQTAFLAPESGRIEWETEADWREPNVLLRAEFHPAARSEYAVCGVPFGELARPTMHRDSWEAAKREVCFQGYCDLSDGTFGGAVLSDCKYGIDVRDCVLSLALLRAPTFPGKHADIGHHAFRYAFLPHKGGTENVRPEAFRMRAPAEEIPFLPPLTASFVSAEGLLAASVKPAENGNGIVVRLYNPTDRPGTAKVRFAPELGISSFRKANLLEGPEEEIPDGILRYGPFEVVTLLVETESGRRE
ncbi:MAG: alpha-mannosidase, partial [Clostridia bacterium]|nr:alpha-mannosidase [Clostridia bacterium]